MAIIANRIKTFSIVPDLLLAFRALIIRLFTGGLILVSIFLWYLSSDSRVSKVIFDISVSSFINPISMVFDSILADIMHAQSFMAEILHARQENIALKLENAKLNKLLWETSYVHAENQYLKEQLKLSEETIKNTLITGRIVGIANGLYKKTAIVNLGTTKGVHEKQTVSVDGNIIGRITHSSDHNSVIMLISDRQSRISVITSISGQRAILAGDGDSGGELLYISEGSDIKIGEILFSSGDGKYYPSGMPVAKIVKKEGGRIYARPIVNLSSIKFVSIIDYENNW